MIERTRFFGKLNTVLLSQFLMTFQLWKKFSEKGPTLNDKNQWFIVRWAHQSYLYIPSSTLNNDLIFWHPERIVAAASYQIMV